MGYRLLRFAVLVFCLALLYPDLSHLLKHNHIFVSVNKAYTDPNRQEEAIRSLPMTFCREGYEVGAMAVIIQNFDDCYLRHPLPLHIVTDTLELPASALAEGSSRPGESSGDVVTLFGAGHIQSRLFFLSEAPGTWVISIHAKHDTPPPVVLEIWLDERQIGHFILDKGDDTWETLSLSTQIEPGFYNLYVRYVNDLFDPALGLDRNAYISYLQITR